MIPHYSIAKIDQHFQNSTFSPAKQSPQSDNPAALILNILIDHYRAKPTDPSYTTDDFIQTAIYYSQFPIVRTLVLALRDKNWRLEYDDSSWTTSVIANQLEVESATIFFNTRSASQLRLNNRCKQNPLCIASPADSMLHELLHIYAMFVDNKDNSPQSQLTFSLYPYRHEAIIIATENKLYANMSLVDQFKRPQRIEHVGRAINVSCPICID